MTGSIRLCASRFFIEWKGWTGPPRIRKKERLISYPKYGSTTGSEGRLGIFDPSRVPTRQRLSFSVWGLLPQEEVGWTAEIRRGFFCGVLNVDPPAPSTIFDVR